MDRKLVRLRNHSLVLVRSMLVLELVHSSLVLAFRNRSLELHRSMNQHCAAC